MKIVRNGRKPERSVVPFDKVAGGRAKALKDLADAARHKKWLQADIDAEDGRVLWTVGEDTVVLWWHDKPAGQSPPEEAI